nr:uncharacterized protein LOC109191245 [Ipomoea trifida]
MFVLSLDAVICEKPLADSLPAHCPVSLYPLENKIWKTPREEEDVRSTIQLVGDVIQTRTVGPYPAMLEARERLYKALQHDYASRGDNGSEGDVESDGYEMESNTSNLDDFEFDKNVDSTIEFGGVEENANEPVGESQNEITKDGERVARSQIKLHCSKCRQSRHNSRRYPNDPSLAEKLNNPRRRVRSKRQQPVENTTIEPNVEQMNNPRRRVTSERPQPVQNTIEPPVEQIVKPSVYIPVPVETHDVLTQEDIDFEMALSSFNFDELTVPMHNPIVIPEQAGLAIEPDDV